MSHYTLCVPVTYKDNGSEKTAYRRIGAIFENHRRETGEIILSVKLDFPVGATELVAFPPKSPEANLVD
ncbi:MAG: hypothetical protein AAFV38_10395 [Pseudomonadota bacterium]